MQVLLLRRRRCPLSRTPFGSPNFFVYTPATPSFSLPCVSKFYTHLRAHRYTLKAYQHTSVLPDGRPSPAQRKLRHIQLLNSKRVPTDLFAALLLVALCRFAPPVGVGSLRFALPLCSLPLSALFAPLPLVGVVSALPLPLRSLPLSALFALPRWCGWSPLCPLPLVRVGKKYHFRGWETQNFVILVRIN